MTHADALEVLAAYLHARNEQGQPNGEPYQPKTLTQFLRAAHLYLQQVSGLTIVVKTGEGKDANYLPMFSDTISLTHKWKQPRPKREAYTTEIFQALQAMVKEHTRIDKTAYLDLVPTVFDWLCLGVFTGSRAGEYAQTVAKRGDFSRVPPTKAAGRWRDYATAFVRQDFTFLDARAHILPNTWATLQHRHQVQDLQICYRFDKSKNNFIIRKYQRGSGFLCPVEAALSILQRSLLLKTTAKEPLGVHRFGRKGHHTYLMSSDVIKVVRQATKRAYPDPKHFLRVNIDRLVAHSNRVTAAVALYGAGWSIERIAARLRWTVEAVDHYIRESNHAIGAMTADAIQGASLI